MTIAKALALLRQTKPHEYTDDVVTGWLADVEQLIVNEILHGHWMWRPHRPRPPILIWEAEDGENEGETPGGTPETEPEWPKWSPERYTTDTPPDTVLLVPDPYSELYVHYLAAQVDYSNAEMLRYGNSLSMFAAALEQFANWFNRTYMPIQRNHVRI